MKKEYTKEDALRECYNLWKWLAKQKASEYRDSAMVKSVWPGWKRFWGTYNLPSAAEKTFQLCPACIYDIVNESSNYCVKDCIIPVFSEREGCMDSNSPYMLWMDSYNRGQEQAGKYAKEIADSARAALHALGEKK